MIRALFLGLLLSQNTPRMPSPATLNGVSVGDGTNWVTNQMPTCPNNQNIQFDGGFYCVPYAQAVTAQVTFDGTGPVGATTVFVENVVNASQISCLPAPTTDAGATPELYLAAQFVPMISDVDAGSFTLNVWAQNGVAGTFSFQCVAFN